MGQELEKFAGPALSIGKGVTTWLGSRAEDRGTQQAIDAIERQGQAQKAAGEWNARQAEREGLLRFATGQQRSQLEAKKGRLVDSAIRARAAASGGSISDPSIVNLRAGVLSEADFRKLMALAGAEESRQQMNTAAAASRFQGDSAAYAAWARAQGMREGQKLKGYGKTATALGEAAKSPWGKWGETLDEWLGPSKGTQVWDNGG